jgi:hypothetical protein
MTVVTAMKLDYDAVRKFKCMTVEELCNLPVKQFSKLLEIDFNDEEFRERLQKAARVRWR